MISCWPPHRLLRPKCLLRESACPSPTPVLVSLSPTLNPKMSSLQTRYELPPVPLNARSVRLGDDCPSQSPVLASLSSAPLAIEFVACFHV